MQFARLWLNDRVASRHVEEDAMPLKPGPITHMTVDGLDLQITSATISEEATTTQAACDWETLTDAYDRITRNVLAEPGPTHTRVIDQDGNPVRPPTGLLRNLGAY